LRDGVGAFQGGEDEYFEPQSECCCVDVGVVATEHLVAFQGAHSPLAT
jgi:hypothetical protein